MATFEEKTYISEFNIKPEGSINVRKTTEILKDGKVVSQNYWRCVLATNDFRAAEVLGAEPYYLNLANSAWASLPQGE
jgi:hypothetical protein